LRRAAQLGYRAACVDAVRRRAPHRQDRAGYDDETLLEDLARAVEAGGASMLTSTATRAEAYWTVARRASSRAVAESHHPRLRQRRFCSHPPRPRAHAPRGTGARSPWSAARAIGTSDIPGRQGGAVRSRHLPPRYADRCRSGDAGRQRGGGARQQLLNTGRPGDS